MNKLGLALIVSVTMFLNASIGVEEEEDIHTLMGVMEELDVGVKSWEAIYLVELSITDMKQIAPQLKVHYDVMQDKDREATTFVLHPKEPTTLLDHSVRVVHQGEKVTLQFSLSGTSWNEQTAIYYKTMTMNLQSNDIFKNMESSTCVKVIDSGIIINGLLNDELWTKLNFDQKGIQKETLKHTNYEKEIIGYSPMFQEEIIVNDEVINVQMMIKKTENEKKELIIGTPVILNEY